MACPRHYAIMARTKLQLLYLGTSGDFPLDVMIRYPRTFIRHIFHVGDTAFDITDVCSAPELNSNPVMAGLLDPSRSGGQMFKVVEVPGQDDVQLLTGKDRTFGIGQAKVMRVALTSGGTAGTADDVTIFNANAPFKMSLVTRSGCRAA